MDGGCNLLYHSDCRINRYFVFSRHFENGSDIGVCAFADRLYFHRDHSLGNEKKRAVRFGGATNRGREAGNGDEAPGKSNFHYALANTATFPL